MSQKSHNLCKLIPDSLILLTSRSISSNISKLKLEIIFSIKIAEWRNLNQKISYPSCAEKVWKFFEIFSKTNGFDWFCFRELVISKCQREYICLNSVSPKLLGFQTSGSVRETQFYLHVSTSKIKVIWHRQLVGINLPAWFVKNNMVGLALIFFQTSECFSDKI